MKAQTTNQQVSLSPKSPLWEELSDQSAASYVGGGLKLPGSKKVIKQILKLWKKYLKLLDD